MCVTERVCTFGGRCIHVNGKEEDVLTGWVQCKGAMEIEQKRGRGCTLFSTLVLLTSDFSAPLLPYHHPFLNLPPLPHPCIPGHSGF